MASGTERAKAGADPCGIWRDVGLRRGFGGSHGGNRSLDEEDTSSNFETLPVAAAASYGDEPGKAEDYGSKGVDGSPVRGRTAKAALSLGR
jgi:hypothetical protein